MEITKEIENLFNQELSSIQLVEVHYPNGGIANGTIKKVRFNPLRILIEKTDEKGKTHGKHRIRFDHIVELKVFLEEGRTIVFS